MSGAAGVNGEANQAGQSEMEQAVQNAANDAEAIEAFATQLAFAIVVQTAMSPIEGQDD